MAENDVIEGIVFEWVKELFKVTMTSAAEPRAISAPIAPALLFEPQPRSSVRFIRCWVRDRLHRAICIDVSRYNVRQIVKFCEVNI